MWIKFEVKGELLNQIKKESDEECRTPTQQALYIIKSYYKDKSVTNNSNLVTDSSDKELLVTDNNDKELLVTDNYLEISTDVIDF